MNNIFKGRIMLIALLIIDSLIMLTKNPVLLFFICISVLTLGIWKKNPFTKKIFSSLLLIGISIIFIQIVFNTSIDISQRFNQGIVAVLKILSLSLITFIFVSSNSISTIIEILSFLPKKFQLMLTITFSIIPVIISETQKIITIQKCRGYKPVRLNIFLSFIPIIIPLLHRSLRRTEQIAIILQTRGYKDE